MPWYFILSFTCSLLFVVFMWNYKVTTLYTPVDGVKTPYLIRYSLFTCKWFSIKLHKILISDTIEMHNHPWSYLSIILWGGYIEHTVRYIETIPARTTYRSTLTGFVFDNPPYNPKDTFVPIEIPEKKIEHPKATWYPAGSILYRKADVYHRLELSRDVPFCLSLIFTSGKHNDWGFNVDGEHKSHTEYKPY